MSFEPLRYRIWKNRKMHQEKIYGGVPLYWTREYDANGQLIYESDVVRVFDFIRHMNQYILVKWEKKTMSWNLGKFKRRGVNFYVVGNLYENQKLSELL